MPDLHPVKFVSIWDGGIEIETDAKLDLATGRVVEIETADADHVDTLEREIIRLGDFDADVEENGMGDYVLSERSRLPEVVELAQSRSFGSPSP